jgi:aspartate-semialdehyde dehydrogenase
LIKKKDKYSIAVAGATGAVGRKMLQILEERNFPVGNLKLLASVRSTGKDLLFQGKKVIVQELVEDSFSDVDIALFSAGAEVSRKFAPEAVKSNCIVIDNSSAYRMNSDVPLVVPEVNPATIQGNPGIIANPNCSTIQMVVALKPIHDKFKIKRVVVSTYQSVSGSGQKAIDELKIQSQEQLNGNNSTPNVYPHQIAFNCLPHIDKFLNNGYTKEEMKMVWETQKIFEDESILVNPTAVRVPVFYGHSEAVHIETKEKIEVKTARKLLEEMPGVTVFDSHEDGGYPTAVTEAAGEDPVFVGRIRADISHPRGLNMWIVADNVRKGAALNSIQIAEILVKSHI